MFENDRDAIVDWAEAAQNNTPVILVRASERDVASIVLFYIKHGHGHIELGLTLYSISMESVTAMMLLQYPHLDIT